jgi:hypothetical protein
MIALLARSNSTETSLPPYGCAHRQAEAAGMPAPSRSSRDNMLRTRHIQRGSAPSMSAGNAAVSVTCPFKIPVISRRVITVLKRLP